MRFKRSGAALALALSGALLLGACTSDSGDEATTAPTAGATETATGEGTEGTGQGTLGACLQDVGITETTEGQVAFTTGPGDWNGYNSFTSRTYSTYNNAVSDQMFSAFTYFGTDGTICDNTDFGTYEVTSEDPLEIKYTISDNAKWSDGVDVSIDDVLMSYAAQNPEWLTDGGDAVFDHVSNSFASDIPDGPQGEAGGKEFTVTYAQPNPDYKLIVGSYLLPAHIVAQQSDLEPQALAQAILDKDADTVKSTADFWNNGWIFNPGELPDESLTPSMGPYKIKPNGWQAGNSITLTANENYWGTPAGTQDLIFRFVDDAGMAQALQNGDVQAIQPQATVDTVSTLQNIGETVTVESYPTLTWEHLDFNFRESSAFADSNGGLALREAFALCVPRQTIVDSLIKPIDPAAVVMNAREVFPFQEDYDALVAETYDGRYDEVDLDAAKAKIEESGVSTPVTVRLGYRSPNERRTDTVAAIKASCDQVGFEVQDAGAGDFFEKDLPNGDYEVALFAWAGSGQIASGQNIYATNEPVGSHPQNYGMYSNADVDAAWKTLTGTLDTNVHAEQVKVIEKTLWDTLFGIPLYAHPGVAAWDYNLLNVRPPSTQNGVSWNASQWVVQ